MSGFPGQRGRVKIILPIVIVILGIGGFFAWRHFSVRESTDDAQVDGHIHQVNAKVGGTIVDIKVKENQFVEAGALLVQIDDRDFKVALASAEADLANARAGENEAKAELPVTSATAGSQVTASQAAMMRAEGAVESAQRYLTLANDRYKLGIDSYLNVIVAQTSVLSNQRTAAALQYQQMTASVQLIKGLGGGWSDLKE